MDKKVKLSVLGFSFNQTQTGVYGLVLAEEVAKRRLMIIVGAPEAQSIAFKLQNLEPPRPLTHDLMNNILNDFYIQLLEVEIYKFDDGIFYSQLLLQQGERIMPVDSRTSDAIALALRLNAPIYTTEHIMQKHAVVIDENNQTENDQLSENDINIDDYSLLEYDELEKMLEDAISGEDYELASFLRDEIEKKTNEKLDDTKHNDIP